MVVYINEFFTYYIMYLTVEFMFYYFVFKRFELKVSRRKAFWLMLLFMNFMPLADTLQLFLTWYNLIDINITTVFIYKAFIIICELVLMMYIHTVCKDPWYQVYMISFPIHTVMILPIQLLFVSSFVAYDEQLGNRIIGLSSENALLYISIMIIIISFGLIITKLSFYMKTRLQFNKIPKSAWYLVYVIWFSLVVQTNKYISDEQYEAITREWNIPGYNYQVGRALQYILIITLIILVANIFAEYRVIKVENNLLKKINDNYVELENQQMEINKLYHDIGNHIDTIRVLIGSDDISKAREYTQDLAESYKNIKKYNVCDNKIVNAVLSQKLKYCDENNISADVDIHIPKSLAIRDTDLISLISNLVDNAIEGCNSNIDQDSYLTISMRCIGDNLAIKVVNSKETRSEYRKTPDIQKTKVKDKKIHGYGLRIIEGVVRKYNGHKEIKDLGNEFSAMVLLSLDNS